MITHISLTHFKSWQRITNEPLAPITGLFGANSSGKTSILQWLLLLKQTVESSDRHQVLEFGDERSLVELGTFNDVVFGHEKPGTISWAFSWQLPGALPMRYPEYADSEFCWEGNKLSFSCEVAEGSTKQLYVTRMAYDFSGQRMEYAYKEAQGKYELQVHAAGDFAPKRRRGRPAELPPPIKFYGFPDQAVNSFENLGFLPDFQLQLEELFGRIFHLGPLREPPQREYTWAGAQPSDMGRRGERVIHAILASRERGEQISRGKGKPKWTLEQYVAHWLKELQLIEDFQVRPVAAGSSLYQVRVQRHKDSTPVLLTDVGFGVSQILPVITLCYYVPKGSTLLLEQPEIHLHPSVQAGLADVFIDALKTRDLQIIIESHSEHLLRRLQRRIAEEQLATDRTAFYFCEMPDDVSRLVPLELDEYGNIKNWPKDFFGDQMGEIVAMTRAQMERMRAPA